MDKPQTIPEMLGFPPADKDRDPAATYSQLSYRARYLLYEDEADDLLRRYPGPDRNKEIVNELNHRYIHEREYHERINGGYEAMEKKMREAGLISEDERRIVDQLNAAVEPDSLVDDPNERRSIEDIKRQMEDEDE